MKTTKRHVKTPIRSKSRVVRTTFFDLIGGLTDRTSDDAVLMKWIQWIFRNCNVRLLRTPAPTRLVVQESRPPNPSQNQSGEIMPA